MWLVFFLPSGLHSMCVINISKSETLLCCSRQYVNSIHHYSPWIWFLGIFFFFFSTTKPMSLNHCERKILLICVLAGGKKTPLKNKNRKQLFQELISPHYCIVTIGCRSIIQPISPGCLYVLAPSREKIRKKMLFMLDLIWTLCIGNRWQSSGTERRDDKRRRRLESAALHFRVGWVHQWGGKNCQMFEKQKTEDCYHSWYQQRCLIEGQS